MSLTAFQRVRRMQQVEEMKPENIVKEEVKVEEIPVPQPEEVKEEVVEENPVEEKVENPEVEPEKEVEEKVEESTNSRRGRRNQQ